METLPDQFRDALSRIEIKGEKRERAIAAHTEIRSYLEADGYLRDNGVDTMLIGSFARHTGIHPGKDVDVFAKLTKLDTTVPPNMIYEATRRVLVARYGDRAEPQSRSIHVRFDADGFGVDVVPAVTMGKRWAIPRRDTSLWEVSDEGKRWVETDPEQLTVLATEMNKTLKVDGQGAYKPVVKLVRQIRKHHFADGQKPGGLYFELLTFWAFSAGVSGTTFAEILASALEGIAAQLASSTPLTDPVLGRPYRPEPDPTQVAAASTMFGVIANRAQQALHQDRCEAAATWRWILGENEFGPCFPLPPGCDEHGRAIRNVVSVGAVGSGRASGFA